MHWHAILGATGGGPASADHHAWVLMWNLVGWLGNAVFFSRFFVQWYATEKKKQVVVPVLFWWLSLTGSLLLLCFAVFYDKHYVVIFAYAFTWIPYIRNLVIHRRHNLACRVCPSCGLLCAPGANYCSGCGTKLEDLEKSPA
jgi:lipid-A-disaccharide synthase-like uncharacterized protein